MIQITVQEWKFVLQVWFIFTFLIFLPFLIEKITTPPGYTFIGLQGINPVDLPVYYSYIEQVKEGDFLFKNLFTPEKHPNFILDPFWLSIGLLAKIFSLSTPLVFQLSKFLLSPFLLIVSYYLVAFFFEEKHKRKICFIFVLFASGLGFWYLAILPENLKANPLSFQGKRPMLPMDLWVPEAYPFLSVYNSPHFVASLTLIVLVFLLSLLAFESGKLIYSLGAGASALFLFQFHPYHLVTIFGVLGMFIVFSFIKAKKLDFKYLAHFFILLIFSLPPVFYYFYTLQKFWVRKMHFIQFATPTPPLLIVFVSYGFPLILALIGVFFIVKKKNKEKRDFFLLCWFFIQFLLIYAPLPFQRRLTAGLSFPLMILAVSGLFSLKEWLDRKITLQKYFGKSAFNKISLCYLFFVGFCLSNCFVLVNDLRQYFGNPSKVYLKKEVKEAMLWLRQNSEKESVILSLPETGNLLPAFALRQVYWGHGHQTAQSYKKLMNLQWFFQEGNEEEKYLFLQKNKIDYLFFGPNEQKESRFNPEGKDYLKKVFSNNMVTIYRVAQ